MMQIESIYLAGPDVFMPNAAEIAAIKMKLCTQHGFTGLDPIDNNVDFLEGGKKRPLHDIANEIERGNVAMMRRADAIIANLTPFRGPSADVGTAAEIGFMRARGRPLLGYATLREYDERIYAGRVKRHEQVEDRCIDPDGMMIEDFGLYDNLMISCPLLHLAIRPATSPHAWIEAFEECLIFLKGYARAGA